MQKILVDGYNLIHADPTLKRLANVRMQDARDALIKRVRAYLGRRSVQVTIVFDGAGGMTDAEIILPGRLQVVYSASGQTADEVIVETVHATSNPRELIVVTSDMADIGRSVGSLGVQVLSSRSFIERLDAGAEVTAERQDEQPDGDDAGDVDYWLERFSSRSRPPEND